MKLCSKDSNCGYTVPKRSPELILEISKDNENLKNEKIIKDLINKFKREGHNFKFYTNYINSKNKNSLNFVLIKANNKMIKIFSNSDQTADLSAEQISKLAELLEKNVV
jgi:hypothetical protein